MNERSIEITEYFAKYSKEKIERLEIVRSLIHDNSSEISEKMWSKVPCFYNNKINIVLRVFDSHFNFITDSVLKYKDELTDYKITPKGMLQIYDHQELPLDILKKIING